MTDTAAPKPQSTGSSKRDLGKLDLRAAPRRVVRFRRGLVIGAVALGSGTILGVTMMALQGPALRIQNQTEELYKRPNASRPRTALPRYPAITARSNRRYRRSDRRCPVISVDPERDQNNQQRKLGFLDQRDTGGIYNPHVLQTPISPYQVMAGSMIAASLITGINSDLPGLVAAQVTENVYDTVSGRTLLIPQGARLIGTYDSVIAFGQSRALLVWQRIILPDGSSIEIDNLPATDTAGYAGLEDGVDYHT